MKIGASTAVMNPTKDVFAAGQFPFS